MDVINLKPLYDNCYKITLDPAAQSQRKPDPLYVVTPCKHGEIYPFGGDTLAVMVTSIRVACRLRREHPELKVHQNADDAMVFLLTVDQIDFIAAYVHPRRKRHLTPERRESLRQVGFGSRTHGEIGIKHTVEGTSLLTTQQSGAR